MSQAVVQHEMELDGYPTLFRDLFLTFRSRGVGREEAQDLAQETIVRTLVHLRRHGRSAEDLGPLVRTIGRNLFIERIRHAKPEVVELSDTLVDDAPEPQELVVEFERREEIQAALRSLTPRHRHVVTLWMQGLSPGQIARELGIKRNAADAILHRARRRLASVLEQSRSALGVIAVSGARIRSGIRRGVDALGVFDASGSFSYAASALAAVGIAGALAIGGPNTAVHHRQTHVSPAAKVASAVENNRTDGSTIGSGATSEALRTGSVPTTVAQEFDVSTRVENPATGEEEDPGLGIVYQQDGDNPGTVESSARSSFDLACASAPSFCSER